MSQLSISISIKLDIIAAALADGAGAFVEHSAFQPGIDSVQADTLPDWTILTATSAGIQQNNNAWYPAKLSGYAGVRWSTLPVALTSNDNYMEVEAIDAWNDSGDYIGPALRMASDQTSFYAFIVSGDDQYAIRRAYQGIWADQKTGTLGAAIAAGDIIRIEVEGDTVRGYVNGSLVDSYTDVEVNKNSTGDPGMIADGLGSTNKIVNFHAGDLASEGNLGVYSGYVPNPQDNRFYTDSCFNTSPDKLLDGSRVLTALHNSSTVPHYIELDFLEFRVPSKIRVHGTTDTWNDWTDVDILTKVESEDSWTEVATALDLDNDGVDGWKESVEFATLQACRYLRIEINSTLNASNIAGAEEIEFYCTGQP